MFEIKNLKKNKKYQVRVDTSSLRLSIYIILCNCDFVLCISFYLLLYCIKPDKRNKPKSKKKY